MRILAIAGSVRRDSYNRRLLHAAGGYLPAEAQLEIFDGLDTIPIFDEDREAAGRAGAGVAALRSAIATADGVLVAAPEYNGSLAGVLKNALDWASRPFPDNCLRGRPAAVIGASTGLFGAVWAQADARKVLRAIGANVIEGELAVAQADQAFTDAGDLIATEHADILVDLLTRLLDAARARTAQPTVGASTPAERDR